MVQRFSLKRYRYVAMTPVIRTASREDFDQIGGLFRALDQLHVSLLPDTFQGFDGPVRPTEILERKVDSEDSTLFVADLGRVLVGFVDVQIIQSPNAPMFKPNRFGLIDNLYVQPELRGSGLANRLFESACDWSRNRGLRQVRLKVYEANRGAVRFYEQKLGMRRIDTTFQLDL